MPVWSVAVCSVTGLVAKAGLFVNRESGCYPSCPLLHVDGAGIAEDCFSGPWPEIQADRFADGRGLPVSIYPRPNGKNNLFGLLPLSPQKKSGGGRIIIPGRPLTF